MLISIVSFYLLVSHKTSLCSFEERLSILSYNLSWFWAPILWSIVYLQSGTYPLHRWQMTGLKSRYFSLCHVLSMFCWTKFIEIWKNILFSNCSKFVILCGPFSPLSNPLIITKRNNVLPKSTGTTLMINAWSNWRSVPSHRRWWMSITFITRPMNYWAPPVSSFWEKASTKSSKPCCKLWRGICVLF